jgi:ABC-type dipeptide/oligopeptide/nickel transport system permease subunit
LAGSLVNNDKESLMAHLWYSVEPTLVIAALVMGSALVGFDIFRRVLGVK